MAVTYIYSEVFVNSPFFITAAEAGAIEAGWVC